MVNMNPVYNFVQRNRMLAIIEKAHTSKAPNLTLVDFDLVDFPELLLICHELYSLNIGHNSIQKLPSNMSELKNLQNLSLEYNNLQCFPAALKELPRLKILNINNNPIKNLTAACDVVTLEILWCNNCCLSTFPEKIGNLTKLETLGARHNQITKLPDGICDLKSLKWLTLEDNKLYAVPNNFNKLQTLRHLNLSKNNFSHIPTTIMKLKELKYLHLDNNEFFTVSESCLALMPTVKISLLNNPLTSSANLHKMFPHVVFPHKDGELPDSDDSSTCSDSSSQDWENSITSSDLNYSATESDTDEDEVLIDVPKLSKYLVTF